MRRTTQLITKLMQSRKESWKKFRHAGIRSPTSAIPSQLGAGQKMVCYTPGKGEDEIMNIVLNLIYYLNYGMKKLGHFRVPPGLCFKTRVGAAFDTEIIFHFHANKTRFHVKGCVPSLILKVSNFGTRKWRIQKRSLSDTQLLYLRNESLKNRLAGVSNPDDFLRFLCLWVFEASHDPHGAANTIENPKKGLGRSQVIHLLFS